MTKKEAMKHAHKLVVAEKYKELFDFGYKEGLEITEDWITEEGYDYYVVTIEDEMYKIVIE